ncbi:MAG: PilN domain-containing protein [Nitrospinota bacterium]
MIHINLHDYREELKKIEIQKRVVKATSIIIGIVLLVLANWMVSQIQLDKIRGETKKLEKAVQALEPKVKEINQMESSQKRKEQIVGGIDDLRGKQFPVSKIINDLNIAVPPGVWLDRISQATMKQLETKKVPVILFGTPQTEKKKKRRGKKKKEEPVYEFIEITGKSLNEQLIAEYIKNLQRIPYYKMTFLQKSSQTVMGGYPIYSFTAYSYMPVDKKKEK